MEEPKKGSRDISDLKARLGLKKGAGAQPGGQTPTGGLAESHSPQATSPQRPVPAPPGFPGAQVETAPEPIAEPPTPAADPRRDPFAAAAPSPQAAYYGYGMPLPGSDDGVPAQPLEKPKAWGKIAGYAGVGLVAIFAGYFSGRSCDARATYNKTIGDSSIITEEVEKIGKNVSKINDGIAHSPGAMKPIPDPDPELSQQLGALNLKDPDSKLVFHTNYFRMEDLAVDRLMAYFNDTLHLYQLIKEDAKKTEGDREAIEKFVKDAAAKSERNYGVIFDMSQAVPVANMVEMGSIVCPKEGETNCKPDEMKFKYRVQSGAEWSVRPIKGKPNDTVTPIFRTPLFTSVASGSPEIVAASAAARRIAEIRGLGLKLANDQKALLTDLKHQSEKQTLFTF